MKTIFESFNDVVFNNPNNLEFLCCDDFISFEFELKILFIISSRVNILLFILFSLIK